MDQIKRIPTNKWTNKYQVDPVFLKSQLEAKAIKYLKNQNYLDFKKISQILKINYNNKYPLGYALKTQKKIVGFVGTLFSKRKINNKNYVFCNIHTWIVNKTHRISSHLLFSPLKKKKCVITVLSPLDQEHSNSSFLKFLIFNDNEESNFSMIIAKIMRKKSYFNVLNILYVSNEQFIKKNWISINSKISNEFNVFFCGQYFLKETDCALPNNITLSLNFKKNICVKNLPTNIKFDTIYSETIY